MNHISLCEDEEGEREREGDNSLILETTDTADVSLQVIDDADISLHLKGENVSDEQEKIAKLDGNDKFQSMKTTDKMMGNVLSESGVSLHLIIAPGKEVCLSVRVTLLPGLNYRSWLGSLLFKGSLRVFEGRNEDLVKKINFQAMVNSMKSSLLSTSSSSSSHHMLINNNSSNYNNNYNNDKNNMNEERSGIAAVVIYQHMMRG